MAHHKQVKHYEVEGHAHYLTWSCFGRMNLFGKPRTCQWFLEALQEARVDHQFDLWAWVIMPNHVHLLIRPRNWPYKMSTIANGLKKKVGEKAIAYLKGRNDPFLEKLTVRNKTRTYRRFWLPGSGYNENVTDVERVMEIIEYIHNNPVRKGLCVKPEDYYWSSAKAWLLGIDDPIPIDRNIWF